MLMKIVWIAGGIFLGGFAASWAAGMLGVAGVWQQVVVYAVQATVVFFVLKFTSRKK